MHTIDRLLGETLEKFLPTKKCFVGKYWFRQTTVLHLEKVFLFSAPRGTVRAFLEKNSRRGGGTKTTLIVFRPRLLSSHYFSLPPLPKREKAGKCRHGTIGEEEEKKKLPWLSSRKRDGRGKRQKGISCFFLLNFSCQKTFFSFVRPGPL